MTNPLVLAATYNKRPLQLTPDGGVDPDKLTRELGNIESALKFSTSFAGTVFNVLDFGADPRGVGASDVKLQSAIDTAGADSVVLFPADCAFRTTSALVARHANQRWVFGAGTTILKAHTGNGVTVSANRFEADYLRIAGLVSESATYAGGRGLYYSGAGTDDSTLLRPVITDIDNACEFAADAGKRCNLLFPHFEPYTTTVGSEGTILKTNTDTVATQREVVGINGSGVVDVSGAMDMGFSGGSVRRPVMSSASFAVRFMGTLFGSSGEPMTFDGASTAVVGCRCAGDITLASTMTGHFIGNPQTAGTFTDSTAVNACVVVHHPLSTNYSLVGKHKMMTGSTTGGLLRTGRRVSPGDAAYSWDPVAGVDQITYAAPITADRAVSLSATNAVDGLSVTVTRAAGATGAFNVNVGTGPVVALTAEKQWATVGYNNSGGYELVAYGTLP